MHVMTTYRYFLEFFVCWCRATENPKKLPLVFPSLITGNRSSILNPVHVCVPWYTAKTAQNKSPGDMFGLIIPLNWIGLFADPRSAWEAVTELQQVGCTSQRASHWELPFYLALRLRCLGVGVCLRLPLSAALACAPLFLSALSTPLWNKCTALAHRLCWLDEHHPHPLFFCFPFVSHANLFRQPTIKHFRERLSFKLQWCLSVRGLYVLFRTR